MTSYRGQPRGSHRRCPQRGTESIADLVAKAVSNVRVESKSKLGKLRRAWRDAVGLEYARQSRVVELRKEVLVVEVASAALGQELSVYHKRDLLRRLTTETGIKLADLRCRITGSPSANDGAKG